VHLCSQLVDDLLHALRVLPAPLRAHPHAFLQLRILHEALAFFEHPHDDLLRVVDVRAFMNDEVLGRLHR
jgi:hypothetical protein